MAASEEEFLRLATVWATLADGTHEQIGGFADNPAPWLDSAHPDIGPPPWERS